MWGPYTTKSLKRFNSLFWNPRSDSVDCFCQNLRDENNRLVPPVVLIIKAIKYLVSFKAKATLIVPKWSSSTFWTFIFGENLSYRDYVLDFIEFKIQKIYFSKVLIRTPSSDQIFSVLMCWQSS